MNKLGDTFREQREKKGMLLRQAAAKLDMDSAVLSKIERDERKATKEQLTGFAKCYKLDLNKLLVQWNVERIADILKEEQDKMNIIQELKAHYDKQG